MKFFFSFCISVILLLSCKKDADLSSLNLGYAYFPNDLGSFIIYDVDSTYYGITTENFHYQIKEVLSEAYIDGQGDPAMKVSRYYRINAAAPWTIIDIWSQKVTARAAERQEENIRFIRMEFPIKEGESWNGNGYNTYPEWQYRFRNVYAAQNFGNLQFAKTVTVEERNIVNLVQEQIYKAVYAENVGMVYRNNRDINIQGAQISGFEVKYQAVTYSTD